MIGDEGVSVEEIMELYPFIISSMIENLENFDDLIEKFKNKYMEFNLEDIDNYSTNIEPLRKDILEEVNNRIWENDNYLDKMKQELEQSKTLENRLLESISKNEKELNIINSKISDIHRKKENLQGTRDKIQVCKLLTNTSFIYKITNISGYVVGQISKTVNCFEFNPQELSKSEITNSLYNILKKNSSEVGTTKASGKAICIK